LREGLSKRIYKPYPQVEDDYCYYYSNCSSFISNKKAFRFGEG